MQIMQMFNWMKKASQRPNKPVYYPDGLMVNTEENDYYIAGGKRFRVYSPRALDSWGLEPVLGSEESVKNIPLAKQPLGFRDGTLIHNIADGSIYLISSNKRRHITSPDVLKRYGWRRGDAITVSLKETDLHIKGDDLD